MPQKKQITSNDALWETINNMTLGERYAFRRKYTGAKIPMHVLIYDTIIDAKEYDEEKLKSKLVKVLPRTKFIYNKHILLQKILESNAEQYMQQDGTYEVLQSIHIAAALRHKQQLPLAIKHLQKAIAHATKLNYILGLQLCHEQKLLIAMQTKNANYNHTIEECIAHTNKFKNCFTKNISLQHIYLQLQALQNKYYGYFTIEYIVQIQKYNEQIYKLVISKNDLTIVFLHYVNISTAILLIANNNFDAAYTVMHNTIIAWQVNKSELHKYQELYVEAVQYYLQISINTNNCTVAIAQIKTLITNNNAYLDNTISTLLHIAELQNLIVTKQCLAINAIILKQEKLVPIWLPHINVELQAILASTYCVANFSISDYNTAYFYAKQLPTLYGKTACKEALVFSYLLLVIITYHMRNEVLFTTCYNNAYAYCYRHNLFANSTKEILQTLLVNFKTTDPQVIIINNKTLIANAKKQPQLQTLYTGGLSLLQIISNTNPMY